MLGIYVGAHANPRFLSTRTFFVRREEGAGSTGSSGSGSSTASCSSSKQTKDEDFSYVRCVENILSVDTKASRIICSILKQVREMYS